MNDHEIDIIEDVKEVENRAKNITEKLQLYKSKALELQHQLELKEESIKIAEQNAKNARARAEEAEVNYKKALELKDGQYQQLINDLFEEPKEQLKSDMEAHSKHAYKTTMVTAVASIIIGLISSLAISIYFQSQSSDSTKNLITKMQENQEKTNELQETTKVLLKKIDSVTQNIWEVDEDVEKIRLIINSSSRIFNNYQSKNDIELLFKLRMSKEAPEVKYSDYMKAFSLTDKIPKEFIPTGEEELRNWDIQFRQLCKKALKFIDDKIPEVTVANTNTTSTTNKTVSNANTNTAIIVYVSSEDEKKYNKYKDVNDGTDYGNLGHHLTSYTTTYSTLNEAFKTDLKYVEKRMTFNGLDLIEIDSPELALFYK